MDKYSAPDHDAAYQEEIHPLVERITLICKQLGIPCFMTFQCQPDAFVTTCINEERSGFDRLRFHRIVNDSWNLDDLLEMLLTDAIKNGHSSELLKKVHQTEQG